ncbi:hypothetical protein AB0M83_36720 [Amycolatopsis sp. NPDC051106]|uniref:hypothetical protein n=1 Tax=unclassified Amycolatopsis TaxID=2618356 RepID=UPI0034302388
MVSLSDVKRWNTAQLEEIHTTIRRQLDVLIHSGDDFGKTVPVDGWSGPAADTATSAHRALMARIDKLAAGASIVGKAIAQASDAITGVQRAVTNAEEYARKYGYHITDTGAVTDTFPDGQPPPEFDPGDRARAHQQVVDDITQALRTADDIDSDLASCSSAPKPASSVLAMKRRWPLRRRLVPSTRVSPCPNHQRTPLHLKLQRGGPASPPLAERSSCMTGPLRSASWTACPPRSATRPTGRSSPSSTPTCSASATNCGSGWTR